MMEDLIKAHDRDYAAGAGGRVERVLSLREFAGRLLGSEGHALSLQTRQKAAVDGPVVGLDLSEYQNYQNRAIDFGKMYAKGIRVVMMRAIKVQNTWPYLAVDSWFERNYESAIVQNFLAVIPYVIFTPWLAWDYQVGMYDSLLGTDLQRRTEFMYDVEITRDPATIGQRLKCVIEDRYEKYGQYLPVPAHRKWGGFYSGIWMIPQIQFDPVFNNLWQSWADYTPPMNPYAPYTNGVWWQFTDRGDAAQYGCNHSTNRVDLQKWIKEGDLDAYWKGEESPLPTIALKAIRNVNIRSMPNTSATILGVLETGQEVELKGLYANSVGVWARHERGWSAILYEGQELTQYMVVVESQAEGAS